MKEQEILDALCRAIVDGEQEITVELAKKIIAMQMDPLLAIDDGIRKGLDIVEDGFRREEVFLPQLVMAGEAAMEGSAILEKALEKGAAKTRSSGVMVIGTVEGDIHAIGKTLVTTLFKTASFSVIDLGVDVPAEKFIEAVKAHSPDILGLSSLLTTTLREQKGVIDALVEAGLRDKVKVMVGGGVVTREWADRIGADAYGEDAMEAVEIG
ncbi:MAG: cobalamin-dependent protein, partial [Deltaproteobacteria bacterium]|nr:cobalamin-dependent protein [Deltaproteobacteria bacterium]